MNRERIVWVSLILFGFLVQGLYSFDDQDILNKAKQYLFDKEWNKALTLLDQIISEYPDSKFTGIVRFYRAKCYKEQKKLKRAHEEFKHYLSRSRNMILREEANVALIDICLQLYKKEDNHNYIRQVLSYLKNRNKTLQYYAAVQLSYLKDKSVSRKAVPVLVGIVENERDQKLQDLAKIALMRIDPQEMKRISTKGVSHSATLNIYVYSKEKKKTVFKVAFPYGLAKFVLDALPDDILDTIVGEGYSIPAILDSIVKGKKIFQMEDKDNKIKIWIE